MAKLSFNISAPPAPKPMFPGWFRGALFIFVMTACSALITAAIFGDPHPQLRTLVLPASASR